MKLLLDEHISPIVAVALRKRGHDVTAVAERGDFRGLRDKEILVEAAKEGRATVTADIRDLSVLGAHRLPDRRWHAGIVLASRRAFPRVRSEHGLLIRALEALLNAHAGEDLTGSIVWLQRAAKDRPADSSTE